MIIFSYLGAKIPRYAILNAEHTKLRFPELNVGMIVSSKENARAIEKRGISAFVYNTHVNDELFSLMQTKRKDFRNGFWRFSLERLMSIDVCFKENISDVVHVESDVVLLNGFDRYIFSKSKVSWLKHKDTEDSAAILAINNGAAFYNFNEDLRSTFAENPTSSEMQLLSKLRKKSPDVYDLMPSIFEDGTVSRGQNDLHENFVFDPATLGMWLFGHDPKNHFGVTRRSLLQGEKNPDAFNLNIRNETGKSHLYLADNTKVLSIHVHTKTEAIFIDPEAQIDANLTNRKSTTKFDPKSFVQVYKEYANRNKRIVFIFSAIGLFKYINAAKNKFNDFFR